LVRFWIEPCYKESIPMHIYIYISVQMFLIHVAEFTW
jgi:hypothetical protein